VDYKITRWEMRKLATFALF